LRYLRFEIQEEGIQDSRKRSYIGDTEATVDSEEWKSSGRKHRVGAGERVQTKCKQGGQRARTKPSEAMGINHFIFNRIRLERQKRSHGAYRPLFQSLTAILTRFSRKLLPMARCSILPNWPVGMGSQAEPNLEEWWSIRMVTDVVKLRTLIGGANRHFHHPPCHFGEKPVLQTSGLSERVSVFGRFMAYQILPNFTNFYQKCVAKGGRRGAKRQLTGGLLRAIYLNRVKSRGSCQALSSQFSVISIQFSSTRDHATRELRWVWEGATRLFRGSSGAAESLWGQVKLLILRWLFAKWLGPKMPRHDESKGLKSQVSREDSGHLLGLGRASQTW